MDCFSGCFCKKKTRGSAKQPQLFGSQGIGSNSTLIENNDSWETPIMFDAPVSGGVPAAEATTLTFMVGGSEEAYKAAKPLFSFMGKNTTYCGSSGTGSAAKICNNLAMAVSMLGVSEAFVLGQSFGVSAATLTKIFNFSSARCWSSATYNPVPGVMNGVPTREIMIVDLHLHLWYAIQHKIFMNLKFNI